MFVALLASAICARASMAPIVKQIDVECEGLHWVARQNIITSMRTKVGAPYSEEAIEADIRSFYNLYNIRGTGFRIFGEPVQGGVKIVVVIRMAAPREEVPFQENPGDNSSDIGGVEHGVVNLREFYTSQSFVDLGIGQPDIIYAGGVRLKMEVRIPGRIRL